MGLYIRDHSNRVINELCNTQSRTCRPHLNLQEYIILPSCAKCIYIIITKRAHGKRKWKYYYRFVLQSFRAIIVYATTFYFSKYKDQ